MAVINTYEVVEELIGAGFIEKQSKVFSKLLFSTSHNTENFMTKDQVAHLEREQSGMKSDITNMKIDIVVIKSDIVNIKKNMATKDELKAEIALVKFDILKWIIPLLLANMGLIISTFFK